jgi:hypothetical protein
VTGAGETERHFWSKVYEQQLSLVEKNKTDELTDSHYQEDAALVSFQKIVCGGQALREYLANIGRCTEGFRCCRWISR